MNSPIKSTIPLRNVFRLWLQVESTAALNTRSEPSSFRSTPSLMQEALRHGTLRQPRANLEKRKAWQRLWLTTLEQLKLHPAAPFIDPSLSPVQQAEANRKARNERKRIRRARR
jgi:hypothetical protein